MKEWIAVLNAADAAARWHVHDRRKGATEEPYINHLLEVASLVAETTCESGPGGLRQTCACSSSNDAIRRMSSCCSGPCPLARKAPISMCSTLPPEATLAL